MWEKVCEDYKCQKVSVDSWVEVLAGDVDDSGNEVEDIFNGDVEMEESGAEKFLGDIISSDGKNMKNIKSRVNKGTGIVDKMLTFFCKEFLLVSQTLKLVSS